MGFSTTRRYRYSTHAKIELPTRPSRKNNSLLVDDSFQFRDVWVFEHLGSAQQSRVVGSSLFATRCSLDLLGNVDRHYKSSLAALNRRYFTELISPITTAGCPRLVVVPDYSRPGIRLSSLHR